MNHFQPKPSHGVARHHRFFSHPLRSGKPKSGARLVLYGLFAAVYLLPAAADNAPSRADAPPALPTLDCVIEPSDIVDVGSAVSGLVASIQVHRGDPVAKGMVVATLESGVEQANLELAMLRASLNTTIDLRRQSAAFSYLTQQRNQQLLQNAAISHQDMEQLKTQTRIAKLEVAQAQDNQRIAKLEHRRAAALLQQRTLHSSVDGVVMERFMSVGEYVEDKPILRLAQLDPLHVEVIVPVAYLGQIAPGMQGEVSSVLPGSAPYLATVERVDRVADAASGTYGVRLSLPNPDYRIPAGLRCRTAFLSSEPTPPTEAVTAKAKRVKSAPLVSMDEEQPPS